MTPTPTTTSRSCAVRPVHADDIPAIAALYNHYIATSSATFKETPVTEPEMAARIADLRGCGLPWLVLEEGGRLAGYAYAGRWGERHAYRHSVESAIYLDPTRLGRGLGKRLYGALLDDLRQRGLHMVIGGIALPNDASIRLHEGFGFRKSAHFTEVATRFGRWVDVGYWELRLGR
jgi:L-amino acid N-acyltransferase YncA